MFIVYLWQKSAKTIIDTLIDRTNVLTATLVFLLFAIKVGYRMQRSSHTDKNNI